jgi:hypothetical protein
MNLQLLEDAGRLEHLVCAKRAPSLSLIGKLLPIDVKTPPSRSVRDLSREELVDRARALPAVALFLRGLVANAEQLTQLQRWRANLARAFQVFLKGRRLRPPPRLAPVSAQAPADKISSARVIDSGQHGRIWTRAGVMRARFLESKHEF